jgi:hypothetical protein
MPPPCLGVPYALSWVVSGGTPPYRWSALELPEGLSLSASGQLTGVARASGELSALVVDAMDRSTTLRTLTLPRQSCWFAHVADGPVARVELFDALLSDGTTGSVRLPPDAEAAAVQSFAFSPDGRFLAVSLDAVERPLRLFAAPDWRELVFDLGEPGRVDRYAWSPDGSVLAAGLVNERGTFLTGARVGQGIGDPGSDAVIPLGLEPGPVDSALSWFAGNRILFDGLGPDANPENRLLYFSAFQSDGFAPIAAYEFSSYTASLRVEPGPDGFFAVVQFMNLPPGVEFYAPSAPGLRVVFHRSDVVLSPTVRHAAHVGESGELRVYPAGEARPSADDASSPLPLGAQPGCGKLLAWSPRGDLLMCVSDEPGASLRPFELSETSATLSPRPPVEGSYIYPASGAALRRRAFSASGRWFAFTTTRELYFAELTPERAVVSRAAIPLLFLDDPSAAFEFSPDERWLLHQQGPNLWLRHLPASVPADLTLSSASPASPDCTEFGSAQGGGWCGNAGGAPGLAWSSDSRSLAYRVGEGAAITTRDLVDHGLRSIACGPGCGEFAFQP